MAVQENTIEGAFYKTMEHEFGIDNRLLKSLHKLAAVSDIEKMIQEIVSQNFHGRSTDVIYRYMKNKLVYLPLEITYSRPYDIDRFHVFRARSNVNEREGEILSWFYSL
jgi:hypothetical protein